MDKDINDIKLKAEERVGVAVKQLLQTMERNAEDLSVVLDGYEATHTDEEREKSLQYGGLVAGYFGIKDLIEDINRALNRKMK